MNSESVDWTQKYEGMRSRGKKTSIELYITVNKTSWWEVIKQVNPTKTNCKFWNDRRVKFNTEVAKGTVNYFDYFPTGGNREKLGLAQGDNQTITDWLNLFLLDLKKPRLKPRTTNTIKTNTRIVKNQLIPEFGNLRLSELRYSMIVKWIHAQEITQKSANNKLGPLRWCFDKALRDGITDNNIFIRGNPIAKLESTYTKQAFTPDEIRKILAIPMPAAMYNLIVFWFYCGLRTGEITALQWSKWDKKENTILINEVRRGGVQEAGTKTQAGTRKISLLPQAVSMLKNQEKLTKLGGIENLENLIFLDLNGQPWDYDFADYWRDILEQADVEYRQPYNIRHTYATMRLSFEGLGNIYNVSHDLGHEEVSTTKKSYVDYELIHLDWAETYNHNV